MKIIEGFKLGQMLNNKKVLKKFRKDKAEYKKKKDRGYGCPAK